MTAPATAQRQAAICFVTADFAGVIRNGGIGTHFWLMSRLLARRGWRVHVLFCGAVDDEAKMREAPRLLASEGITFATLDAFPKAPGADIRHFGGDADTLILSESVVEALETLHAEHHFDLIEFPDWGALGLRPIQAKRAGAALLDVPLAVKLHSTSQWQREGNLQLRASPRDLKMEFCERYAFEHADVQLSPSRYMLEYSRGVDWRVRDDAVVAYPYPDPEPSPARQVPEIKELVFFGRLEERKGLNLFLDALDSVDPSIPALFLGKDTRIGGRQATELIAERLDSRPHRIETELDREGALAEFAAGDRLAVIASRAETFGFTVAECVANRIPFVASRAGGIPEVIAHPEGRRRWLFEPTADGLREILERRLASSGQAEIELRAEVATTCDPQRWNDAVEASYRGFLAAPRSRVPRPLEPPTVTVAVAHFNHDRFLAAALASLAAQTRPPDEVLVVDDGSTSEAALRVFDEQAALYPQWTFLHQDNAGPGAVRNHCLERASSTYFLPFDSDNIATPHLLERFVEAMQRHPGRAATTCHNLAFVEDADIERQEFAFRYSPTGGPLLCSSLENVFGDTCALFSTELLRSVGGFETERWSPHEDWETLVKLRTSGLDVDVLPLPLFYYRTSAGGRLEALTEDPAMTFRHRHRMIDAFYADAELTGRERRDLWESLLAFDHVSTEGLYEQTAWYREQMRDLRVWHDKQIEELRTWGEDQLETLRAHMSTEVANEAERADRALADLRELQRWHESEMEELQRWHAGEIELASGRGGEARAARGDLEARSRLVRLRARAVAKARRLLASRGRRVAQLARTNMTQLASRAAAPVRQLHGSAAAGDDVGAIAGLARQALTARRLSVAHTPLPLLRQPDAELRMTLDYVLAVRAASTPDFFFVQIGAFDGRTADPLYGWVRAYEWRGLLVEPQPRAFAELTENYGAVNGLEFRQVAAGEHEEDRTLYTVADRPDVPHWAGLLASFDRDVLVSHRQYLPNIDALVEETTVRCIPLNQILGEAETDHVDLLQIDVEGYDHELIRLLDLGRFKPSIVRFEHVHLTWEGHEAAIAKLIDHGYKVCLEAEDTLAYKPSDVAPDSRTALAEGPARLQAAHDASLTEAHEAHLLHVAELERRLLAAKEWAETVGREAELTRLRAVEEATGQLSSRLEHAEKRAEAAERQLRVTQAAGGAKATQPSD